MYENKILEALKHQKIRQPNKPAQIYNSLLKMVLTDTRNTHYGKCEAYWKSSRSA